MTNATNDDRASQMEAAVATVLRMEAAARGVVPADIAARTTLSESTARRTMNGQTALVLVNAMRIAEVLGIDFGTVWELAEDRVRRGL